MEGTLEATVKYVKERHAFGKPLIEQQNTRFKLAQLHAQVRAARIFWIAVSKMWLPGGSIMSLLP